MNTFFSFRPKPRATLARFFVVCALLVGAHLARAQEFEPAPPISNASGLELQAVKTTLAGLKRAAVARDAAALKFFGAGVPADDAPLQLSERLTHLAVATGGALARQEFTLTIERVPRVVLASGTHELFLRRAPDSTFAIDTVFATAPDALQEMQKLAAQKWGEEGDDSAAAILDLVASRIGGRWIALRSQLWNGQLSDSTPPEASSPRDFLQTRMASAPAGRALTAHFLLQRGQRNWVGLGAAFNEARRLPRPADSAATLLRQRVAGNAYALPEAHRDFAIALGGVGLWNEAADELQKAALLQPGLVSAQKLKEAEANRARDPENIVKKQRQNEEGIGFSQEHPQYLIQALAREQSNTPTVVRALRLALEYSRLAEEDRAAAWGKQAQLLMNRGAVRPQDAGWVQLLAEHLRERQKLAKVKPSNIVRSKLFTVRVWPGDARSIALLGALEEARHTVYADFGIPMGNTEVILWRNQGEFARYTTQFSDQGGSEFVAALTLTKLVSTQKGPFVLGEEVNTFSDPRDANAPRGDTLFGTIAHEYGHVAVRQLSRGRLVPVWFNEGVATSVEGGYEGYIGRVRRAVNADAQLSMREMLEWGFDGERAFLAYSQANSIVDFIVYNWATEADKDAGKKAVLDILRQIGADVAPDKAFRNVLGVSQGELWEQWVQNGIT